MPTENRKRVVAKLQTKDSMDNRETLLVFVEASGIITYHLKGYLSGTNMCLSNLGVKKPLPDVREEHGSTSKLVEDIIAVVETGTSKVIGSVKYEG